jgi:hypothetical protein
MDNKSARKKRRVILGTADSNAGDCGGGGGHYAAKDETQQVHC